MRQAEVGRVVVLSRHGRAVAVVLSVSEYEDLAEAAEAAALQKAVDEGMRETEGGAGRSHAEVREHFLAVARASPA